jgi:predicted nucleic acid-binding protein
MNAFPDTSFLCSLYRKQVYSPRAISFMDKARAPLPVTTLLLLEFRQSTRLQTWLHDRDRTRGFSEREASTVLQHFQGDLSTGVYEIIPVDWAETHLLAESLSAKHTRSDGHRVVDILHVATALHLGATDFLTFDSNQKMLAEAENLVVPL